MYSKQKKDAQVKIYAKCHFSIVFLDSNIFFLKMNAFIQVTTADPSLGKIDITSMPHQTLMELLVSDFDDKIIFRDPDSYFTEISHWKGVTANENGEVTEIHWERDILDDFYWYHGNANEKMPQAGGSVDLKWLPSTLRYLNISYLSLRGTINTHGLPRGLVHLDVTSNKFEGTFATSGLPIDLTLIRAENNKLTGTLDLSTLPPTLKILYLQKNAFSGTLDFAKIPESLESIRLSDNQFSGEMNLQVLPESVKDMSLEANRFDTEKSLMIRKGGIDRFFLDKGDVQEVVNTDGERVDFTVHLEYFIRMSNVIA